MAPRDSSQSSNSAGVDLWADTAGSSVDLAQARIQPEKVPQPAWKSDSRSEAKYYSDSASLDRDRSSLGLESHGDIAAALKAEAPSARRERWRTDDPSLAAKPNPASKKDLRDDAAASMALPGVLLTIAGLSLFVLMFWRVAASARQVTLPGPPTIQQAAGELRGNPSPTVLPTAGPVALQPIPTTPAKEGPVAAIPSAPLAPAATTVEEDDEEARLRRLLHSIRVETSRAPVPPMDEPGARSGEPAPPAPIAPVLPKELIPLSSPRAESLLGMAREFELRGRPDSALKRYREVVAQHPGTQAATEAAARITALEREANSSPAPKP